MALKAVVRESSGVRYLECDGVIEVPLDLVPLCAEHDTNLVLVEDAHLPDAFFDLKTGLAGELLQKMQNYGIRVAAVFPPEREYSDRFREFLVEARHGSQFRVFDDREAAESWLVGT